MNSVNVNNISDSSIWGASNLPSCIHSVNKSLEGNITAPLSELCHSLETLSYTLKAIRPQFEVLKTEGKSLGKNDKVHDDPRTRDKHSSYYIPFYFPIFGKDGPMVQKRALYPNVQSKKNVRPKGTRTNRKLFR